MGQRYGREPITFDVCADCGAVVADRQVHNDWHNRQTTPRPPMEPLPEAEEFRRLLFTVAREHLDPDGHRLEWSPGFSGKVGPAGFRELGAKFGWGQPNDTGQGMVYVAVGDISARDRLPCGQYDNPRPSRCGVHAMADRSVAETLVSPERLELHWSRPDRTYVFAIVDSTFRNNSLTPTQAALPTLERLEAFVMDPRLALP